jgi:ABC-type sugar transport system permease subunit
MTARTRADDRAAAAMVGASGARGAVPVSPSVRAAFVAFTCYPLVRSLWLSLHKCAGPRHEVFVGLDNYRFLLRDRLFLVVGVEHKRVHRRPARTSDSAVIGLALLLNSPRVRARSMFRFAFFSTYLVGPVFVAAAVRGAAESARRSRESADRAGAAGSAAGLAG